MIDIELPFPPSVNHYWRHVGPKMLVSAAGRRYRLAVGMLISAERVKPLAGRLRVSVLANPPDRRQRDLDNLCKALLDAMQHGGAFVNDSQIDALSIERGGLVAGGGVRVLINEIGGDGGSSPPHGLARPHADCRSLVPEPLYGAVGRGFVGAGQIRSGGVE